MVKRILTLLALWAAVVSPVYGDGDKIDAATFDRLLNEAAADHARHEADLKLNELHTLVEHKKGDGRDSAPRSGRIEETPAAAPAPEDNKGWPQGAVVESGAAGSVESEDKRSEPGSGPPVDASQGWPGVAKTPPPGRMSGGAAKAAPVPAHRPVAVHGSGAGYHRMPPSWNLTNASSMQPVKVFADDADAAGQVFGIRRGTEIRARLVRATTNVEPGKTEFVTTSDCIGDNRDLPSGTTIFFGKSVAQGSNRLYFTSTGEVNAITPNGKEFTVWCSVTDITLNKQLGLVGAITTDQKLIQRSMASGAFAASKGVVSALSGDIAADAVGAAADSALSEKEKEAGASLRAPTFVILVSPQDVYIRVDKSF